MRVNLKSLTTFESFKMISPHIQRSYIDMRERKQPIATILHVVVKKNAEVHRKTMQLCVVFISLSNAFVVAGL